MEYVERLAAEQFANIEITRFMILDLWVKSLIDEREPLEAARRNRARQLKSLQAAVDQSPDSFIRHALLRQAEQNWCEIVTALEGRPA